MSQINELIATNSSLAYQSGYAEGEINERKRILSILKLDIDAQKADTKEAYKQRVLHLIERGK